jgi:outer membrane beta-barrel protein
MKLQRKKNLFIVYSLLIGLLGFTLSIPISSAEEINGPVKETSSPEADGEQVNVQGIKERYWARGNEAELGVVQNRTYSKTHKLELGLLGGIAFSDPFLTVKYLGGDLGYHLSEFVSLHLLAWQYTVSPSNALLTFQAAQGATTNTNYPSLFFGTELDASIIYGKLSVLGKSIIYYDLHLLGGVGATKTETGTYVTPSLGIGQRFYLSKVTSLRIDYRLQYYNENLIEKQITTKLGQPVGARDNFNNTITLGLSFMLFGN